MVSEVEGRLRRAESWLRTLPESTRPDGSDVETCARLGVEEPEALERLVLKDTVGLLRVFPELLRVLKGTGGEELQSAAPDSPNSGAREEESMDVDVPTSAAEDEVEEPEDLRAEAVRSYVQLARDLGPWDKRLDDEWVSRLLEDDDALLEMPTALQRKHSAELRALLGVADAVPSVAAASAEEFTRSPNLMESSQGLRHVTFEPADAAAAVVSWPRVSENEFAWFKVFAGLGVETPVGFESRLVGQGVDPQVTDDEVLRTPLRRYAVWVHRGRDKAEATQSEPRLWARGVLVAPVDKVHVRTDDRRVSATWTTADGVDRVEVHRFPSGRVPTGSGNIGATFVGGDRHGENRTGFEEFEVAPGDYVYRFTAITEVDGVDCRSVPVDRAVTVQVHVPAVTDLDVQVDAATGRLTASWPEVPGVHVELHCTGEEPAHGIGDHQLDRDGLERFGLGDRTRVSSPPDTVGGRATADWDWPRDLSRLHVVAVSNIGDAYRVGATQSRVRVGSVESLTLHERVEEQYLTFAWPAGASTVVVRQGHADEPDSSTWSHIREIDRSSHQRYGGIRLRDLPSAGCRLGVVGYAIEAGQQIWGEPAEIEYPGLKKVSYWFESQAAPVKSSSRFWKRKGRTPTPAGKGRVHVECTPPSDANLILVVMPGRIPLQPPQSGQVPGAKRYDLGPLREEGARAVFEGEVDELPPGYWRRIFVDVPDDEQSTYAVLDPDVSQLRGPSA